MDYILWLKRNSLLLINLCVIGLMLWLTISFLALAIAEREQAVNLSLSIDSQYATYSATAAHLDQHVNAHSPKLSSDAIRTLFSAVDRQTARVTADQHSLSSIDQILALQTKLHDAIPQQQLTGLRRALVLSTLTSLSNALRYLPDKDAATVSGFQELLVELTQLRAQLAIGSSSDSAQAVMQERTDRIDLISTRVGLFSIVPIAHAADFTKALASMDELALAARLQLDELALAQFSVAKRNFAIDVGLLFMCFLITTTTILLNRRIKRLAYTDSLTGLENRLSLEHWLLKPFDINALTRNKQAMIFLDLNRFKAVNDTYGHEIGDDLLKVVGQRIKKVSPANAIVARIGGDEFGVLLREIDNEEQAMLQANTLVEAISKDINISGHIVSVGASAGVSICPDDCVCGLELLKNADMAMYNCKGDDTEGAFRYTPEMEQTYQHRLDLEHDLKSALDNDEFVLHYQPNVSINTGLVVGVEALLRWVHPEKGTLAAVEIIAMAEQLGLISEIDAWVVDTAVHQIAEFQRTQQSALRVAVNISSMQFSDQRFVELVNQSIESSGLGHQSLELELKEHLLMHDVQRAIAVVAELNSSGVNITIDDFGTGYSSLQYLPQLALTSLKIDSKFIAALDDVHAADSVANSIVHLAHLHSFETLAEKVETQTQIDKLHELGVNRLQGNYYSVPVPFDELGDVIARVEGRAIRDQGKAA